MGYLMPLDTYTITAISAYSQLHSYLQLLVLTHSYTHTYSY